MDDERDWLAEALQADGSGGEGDDAFFFGRDSAPQDRVSPPPHPPASPQQPQHPPSSPSAPLHPGGGKCLDGCLLGTCDCLPAPGASDGDAFELVGEGGAFSPRQLWRRDAADALCSDGVRHRRG